MDLVGNCMDPRWRGSRGGAGNVGVLIDGILFLNRDGMLVRAGPTGRLGKGTGYGYWLPGPDRLRE